MKTIYKKLLLSVLLLPFSVLAQSTLTGTVTDKASGQPLPGVSVVVQGTTNGTSTDFDGKFSLSGLKNGQVVVFSFIGYKEVSETFTGQKSVTISLAEETNELAEVVVQIGYGSVRKKDATGSVTQLNAKDFNKGAMVTAENLLNGKVAGLTINTSGAPGSGSEIRIRGGSSLFAKNDPLIVIDGLPIDNNTGTGSTSILASLNPSTIESFTVLKDASATAIYGSRASNGVIIITTKKGGKQLSVDYNVQYGAGRLTDKVDVFSADEFRAIIAEKRPDDVSKLGTANTNWQDAIYRNTDFIDNNLSLKGNLFGVVPTRLTLGNTFQEGLRLTNNFNRNTVALAMNPSFLKDHLKIKINANYSNEKSRFADGVEGTALRFDPTQPIYDSNSIYGGFFEYYNAGNGQLTPQTPRNPVAQLLQTNDNGVYKRLFGNMELDYKLHFFPELRLVANFGYDQGKGLRTRFASPLTASSGSNNNIPFGTNERNTSYRRNSLADLYFVYSKSFGKSVFDFTGGYSYQKFESSRFVSGNVFDPNLAGGPTGFPRNEIDTDVVLIGFFARTNLSIAEKFLFTFSYRRDGSSRFSEDNRWGNFPAAAFAWKLKDDLFKNSKFVSDFKLRLGWGITGQQDIPAANDYLQRINLGSGSSQYVFGNAVTPIAVPARLSPDLKWEETTTYNVGFDYGFFDNRLSGAIDVFYKESKDLLVDAAVSDGANFSNRAWQNIGSFTTKGVEFSVNYDIIRNSAATWTVNFNATKFERRIDELIYDDIRVGDNLAGTGTQGLLLKEGFSPYSFFVFKQLYDNAGKPIDGAFADLNGDGVVTDADKYIYKNPDPDFTFGFASNVNYKNFDLSFNMRASIGNNVLNAVNARNAYFDFLTTGNAPGNIPSSVLETEFASSDNRKVLSDIYIENASFLRMDNITLGYTFSNWLNGKASVRLSAGVQNAFVITNYSGLDPEITNNGVDNTIYPRQRTILFGANIKF